PEGLTAGGYGARDTPVPIPNTEVKPRSADGTAPETVWESTSSRASSTRNARPASADRAFSHAYAPPHTPSARQQRSVTARCRNPVSGDISSCVPQLEYEEVEGHVDGRQAPCLLPCTVLQVPCTRTHAKQVDELCIIEVALVPDRCCVDELESWMQRFHQAVRLVGVDREEWKAGSELGQVVGAGYDDEQRSVRVQDALRLVGAAGRKDVDDQSDDTIRDRAPVAGVCAHEPAERPCEVLPSRCRCRAGRGATLHSRRGARSCPGSSRCRTRSRESPTWCPRPRSRHAVRRSAPGWLTRLPRHTPQAARTARPRARVRARRSSPGCLPRSCVGRAQPAEGRRSPGVRCRMCGACRTATSVRRAPCRPRTRGSAAELCSRRWPLRRTRFRLSGEVSQVTLRQPLPVARRKLFLALIHDGAGADRTAH